MIVLNDDHNTFDHVAKTLARVVPGVTVDQGYAFAERIHNAGQAIVWSGQREPAELYWEQLSIRGPDDGPTRAGVGRGTRGRREGRFGRVGVACVAPASGDVSVRFGGPPTPRFTLTANIAANVNLTDADRAPRLTTYVFGAPLGTNHAPTQPRSAARRPSPASRSQGLEPHPTLLYERFGAARWTGTVER